MSKRELVSKNGNRFAFAAFTDQSGQYESVVFSDVLADAGEILEPGCAVIVHVEATRNGDEVKLKALLIESLDKAAGAAQTAATIELDERAIERDPACLSELPRRLRKGGRVTLRLILRQSSGAVVELTDKKERYHVSPELTSELEALAAVRRIYSDFGAGRIAA